LHKVLGRRFYSRKPTLVARDLIGKTLVRRLEGAKELKGIIVETEAYGGSRDPASHAYRGRTSRNEVMFGEAGHAYVYFTYGFHHCLNFVTGNNGVASAVLIRALEPTAGTETMALFRNTNVPAEIASGPGKLCQAMKIDRKLNGIDVTDSKSPIHVLDRNDRIRVKSSRRIGISGGRERRWRFFATGNENVSR
jgi:DNA-3-methyladenine glycosylase